MPAPTAVLGGAATAGLPDFSQLVDRYGPAVVNVEVVEKRQSGGIQGISPNDPFYDFFRRFGIPAPDSGPARASAAGSAAPARGSSSAPTATSSPTPTWSPTPKR